MQKILPNVKDFLLLHPASTALFGIFSTLITTEGDGSGEGQGWTNST